MLQGYTLHKLTILSRLAEYVSVTSKSPRPTVMTAFVAHADMSPNAGPNQRGATTSPKPYVAVDSSESDWPLSDFIRQHIIDNKVNTSAMTRKEFKRTMSRGKMTKSSSPDTAINVAIASSSSSRFLSRPRSASRGRSEGPRRVASPVQSAYIAENTTATTRSPGSSPSSSRGRKTSSGPGYEYNFDDNDDIFQVMCFEKLRRTYMRGMAVVIVI